MYDAYYNIAKPILCYYGFNIRINIYLKNLKVRILNAFLRRLNGLNV